MTRRPAASTSGDLKAKISARTAAVYIESPGYLGLHRGQRRGDRRASRAQRGAETIMGVDPVSLGVLAAAGRSTAPISPSARRSRSACT